MKLSKQQLFNILKNPKMYKDNNVQAQCPYCLHFEFFISLNDNHPWQCWRKSKCGAQGNIYTLLHKLGLQSEYNIKEDISWQSNVAETLDIDVQDNIDIDLCECKLPIGFKRVYDDDYLNERGFKDGDYNDYMVGITKLVGKLINYVIFMIYQDYKPVAYIARCRLTKKECDLKKLPRYINSNSDFAKILGGYDELDKDMVETVILVEGLFDKKNVDDLLNLKDNQAVKCCYTFKCHVSDEQLCRLKIKGVKKILLLYDADVLEKVKKEAFNLEKHFEVQVGLIECLNENGEVKDPGELNKEELQYILNTTYTPFELNKSKVQILYL